MPEGEEEIEPEKKTLLQEQLHKSYELLEKLTIETIDYVTNVRVANESREINRREVEGINREQIMEYLDKETLEAEEHFNTIDEKWLNIFSYNDPLIINEEILNQKEKCDAIIKKKDEVIARLKNEVTIAEGKFNDDQKKQMEDIKSLTDRIENQLILMRRAYSKELEIIEDVMLVERKILIDATDRRWEELHKKRDAEEDLNCDVKFQQLEEFEEICTQLRVDHQEKYRDLRIKLGNNIENLQCEFEKIKKLTLLNSEKLDYNYQVLKKREAENLLIRSQQKRKINKLQDTINSLRAKIRNYNEQTMEQIEKLTNEVKKLRGSVLDIEEKSDMLCKLNEIKYQQLWDFNKKRCTTLLHQVLSTDKVLHEQQLGLKWTSPEVIIVEKADLPSYKSALQMASEIYKKSEAGTSGKETMPEPSEEEEPKEGETLAHRRILRIILKLIADKSGFLMEEKLKEVLQPYAEEDRALVKVDSVFSALEIKNRNDIDILLEYFLPYTHCPICMNRSMTNTESLEKVLKTYDLSNESTDTSEVQLEVFEPKESDAFDILSAVHQPHAVIEEIVSNITQTDSRRHTSTSDQTEIDTSKKSTLMSNVDTISQPIKISKASKARMAVLKTSCYKKHPLVISSVYILRALREFLSRFYLAKDEIVTMSSRLSRKRSTISRLMTEDDVVMYWNRFKKIFSSEKEEVWDALYMGLQKYHAILKDRKKLNDEVLELRQQHAELKQMLNTYQKESHKNMKPPCLDKER